MKNVLSVAPPFFKKDWVNGKPFTVTKKIAVTGHPILSDKLKQYRLLGK
jgi:hypothetical protein